MSRFMATDFTENAEGSIFEECSIFKILPFKGKNNFVIHHGGHVSAVIKFSGKNSTQFDHHAFEAFLANWSEILSSIPPEICNISFTSERVRNRPKKVDVTHPLLANRKEYFDELSNNYAVFENVFYLTVLIKKPRTAANLFNGVKLKDLFSSREEMKKKLRTSDMEQINERAELLSEVLEKLVIRMDSIGLEPHLLSEEREYIDLFSRYYRPKSSELKPIVIDQKKEELRASLFQGVRCEHGDHGFDLDGYHYRLFVMDQVPMLDIYGGSIGAIVNMPYEYIYTVSCNTLSLYDTNKKIQQLVRYSSMRRSENDRSVNKDILKEKDHERFLREQDAWAESKAPGAYMGISFFAKISHDLIDSRRRSGATKEEVLRKIDDEIVSSFLSQFGLSTWSLERKTHWFVYNKAIPGLAGLHSTENKRSFVKATDVPYCVNFWDNKSSDEHTGFNHFLDECGNYVTFNPFSKNLDNPNGIITGGSGTGKSVLMSTILTQLEGAAIGRKKPQICIIDNSGDNGSYFKIGKLFNATIINFSGPERPYIQLFEINPNESIPTNNKISELKGWLTYHNSSIDESKIHQSILRFYSKLMEYNVSTMKKAAYAEVFEEVFGFKMPEGAREIFTLKPGTCKPYQKSMSLIMSLLDVILSANGTGGALKEYGNATVQSLVNDLYENKQDGFPMLYDLYKYIQSSFKESADTIDLINRVRNWTREGSNYFFDAETNINLNNDFIIVDMKGLESEPGLQTIYTLLFNEIFSRKMYYIKDRQKALIRDEVWKLLSNPLARSYIVEDVRTARKNGFTSWILTQNIIDLYNIDESAASALINNSSTIIMGRQQSMDDVRRIQSILAMPTEIVRRAFSDLDYLGRVNVRKGGRTQSLFSRYLFKVGGKYFILRNNLSEYEKEAFSTSPEDFAAYNYYMKVTGRFKDIGDYLEYMSQKRYKGDEGLAKYLWSVGFDEYARSVCENVVELVKNSQD